MILARNKRTPLFITIALCILFLNIGNAKSDIYNQIGYPNVEYYSLDTLHQKYTNYDRIPLFKKYVLTIFNGVRSRGLSETEVFLAKPFIIKRSANSFKSSPHSTNSNTGSALPLIQKVQLNGTQQYFLNITPSRLLAELWLISNPDGPREVLNTYAIDADEFVAASDRHLDFLRKGNPQDLNEIKRIKEKVPKHLAFLTKLITPSASSGAIPQILLARYRVEQCVEKSLPLMEILLEQALKSLQNNNKPQPYSQKFIRDIPECLR